MLENAQKKQYEEQKVMIGKSDIKSKAILLELTQDIIDYKNNGISFGVAVEELLSDDVWQEFLSNGWLEDRPSNSYQINNEEAKMGGYLSFFQSRGYTQDTHPKIFLAMRSAYKIKAAKFVKNLPAQEKSNALGGVVRTLKKALDFILG